MSGSPSMAPLQASASMTQLPPSPDLNSRTPGTPLMLDFSLDGATRGVGTTGTPIIRRLRSVAKYDAFFPRALACSGTLASHDERGASISSSVLKNSGMGPSCLGAVAGPQGVALFRLSRPHVPLLILSHANTASPNSISSLSFEPKEPSLSKTVTNSLYLAATRGSGVLVWDASGHSPNPLVGRVGMDQALPSASSSPVTMELEDSRLTSMCWMSSPSSKSPLLATTTASTICLWDLRTPSSNFKPTTKFGTTRKGSGPTTPAPLVQVACSHDSEECATIDAAGIVQIYDVRMNDRVRSMGGNPLSTFAAHETAGVGIAYFGTKSVSPDNDSNPSQSRWLTWGLDEPLSSAVIKIWTKNQGSTGPTAPTLAPAPSMDATLWDPTTSASHVRRPRPSTTSTRDDYTLTAQCVRPNLACARVCLAPVQNKFMAIGHLANTSESSSASFPQENANGWWAELYSLSEDADETATQVEALSIRTFGLEKMAGFKGGDATGAADKRALVSVLGSRTKLGSLQAAELSLASSPRDKGGDDNTPEVELLLCCLSDTGVVSTHVVPEALPKTIPSRSMDLTGRESPKRSIALRNNLIRTAFPSTNQARVYPEDREGTSLLDAASFWGVSRAGVDSSAVLHRVEERRMALEDPSSSPQKTDSDVPMIPSIRRNGPEGMPFDMDVPVAYGSVTAGNTSNLQIGMTDISTGAIASTNSMGGVVEEGETVSADPLQKTSIMDTIETERVPCPRLCGAVFGKGNGGLIVFHNGEVKKMWHWYQRTDSVKLSSNSGGKTDPTTREREGLRRVHNATGSGSTHPLSTREEETPNAQATPKSGPRTLKELFGMMAAAKEAQWREEITSDGSASDDILSAGDNFFEDESLGSNSSDDDDDDDGHGTPPPAEDMYKRYFGGQPWKGSVGDASGAPSSPSPSKTAASPSSTPSAKVKKIQPFLGPSSDMLSPVVVLTRRFDREMLGYQSIELAEGWELGPWDLVPNEVLDELPLALEDEERKTDPPGTADAAAQKVLLPYRHFLNSPTGFASRSDQFIPIVRTKSDGNLEKKYKPTYDANATISSKTNDSFRRMLKESGFQGGEGSVRPNMEESMKFLKKLFTQPQEGGAAGFSTVLSPPDRPHHLFTSHLPKEHRNFSAGSVKRTSVAGDIEHGQIMRLGVYTLRVPKLHPDDSTKRSLDEIERICLHNASVCADLGDHEKEAVWNLLAQTVDRQLDVAGSQSFNGWGGNGGGALGVELVGNLLKYYEARGDCQMLATMTCVLSGGRRSSLRQQSQLIYDDDRPYLLPLNQDEKYDMYIRRYADLLYSWGLLSLRAELNKHLIRIPATNNNNPITHPVSGRHMGSVEENSDLEGRRPGIAVVFQCPKCGEDTEFNTNVCRNCRDFAFRCSICDNAVQGLFTVCDFCGHGGHVDHMTSWFAKHLECPTGCGCTCMFSPLMAGASDVAVPAMVDNDPLQDD